MAKIRNGSSSGDRGCWLSCWLGHPLAPSVPSLFSALLSRPSHHSRRLPRPIAHPPSTRLTSHSLAAVGVAAAGGVALHTQTLVAAVGVDAALAAGEGGAALVHVGACPAVVLQAEARAAAALWAQGALGGHQAGVCRPPTLETWGQKLSWGSGSLHLGWLALTRRPSLARGGRQQTGPHPATIVRPQRSPRLCIPSQCSGLLLCDREHDLRVDRLLLLQHALLFTWLSSRPCGGPCLGSSAASPSPPCPRCD